MEYYRLHRMKKKYKSKNTITIIQEVNKIKNKKEMILFMTIIVGELIRMYDFYIVNNVIEFIFWKTYFCSLIILRKGFYNSRKVS